MQGPRPPAPCWTGPGCQVGSPVRRVSQDVLGPGSKVAASRGTDAACPPRASEGGCSGRRLFLIVATPKGDPWWVARSESSLGPPPLSGVAAQSDFDLLAPVQCDVPAEGWVVGGQLITRMTFLETSPWGAPEPSPGTDSRNRAGPGPGGTR